MLLSLFFPQRQKIKLRENNLVCLRSDFCPVHLFQACHCEHALCPALGWALSTFYTAANHLSEIQILSYFFIKTLSASIAEWKLAIGMWHSRVLPVSLMSSSALSTQVHYCFSCCVLCSNLDFELNSPLFLLISSQNSPLPQASPWAAFSFYPPPPSLKQKNWPFLAYSPWFTSLIVPARVIILLWLAASHRHTTLSDHHAGWPSFVAPSALQNT